MKIPHTPFFEAGDNRAYTYFSINTAAFIKALKIASVFIDKKCEGVHDHIRITACNQGIAVSASNLEQMFFTLLPDEFVSDEGVIDLAPDQVKRLITAFSHRDDNHELIINATEDSVKVKGNSASDADITPRSYADEAPHVPSAIYQRFLAPLNDTPVLRSSFIKTLNKVATLSGSSNIRILNCLHYYGAVVDTYYVTQRIPEDLLPEELRVSHSDEAEGISEEYPADNTEDDESNEDIKTVSAKPLSVV